MQAGVYNWREGSEGRGGFAQCLSSLGERKGGNMRRGAHHLLNRWNGKRFGGRASDVYAMMGDLVMYIRVKRWEGEGGEALRMRRKRWRDGLMRMSDGWLLWEPAESHITSRKWSVWIGQNGRDCWRNFLAFFFFRVAPYTSWLAHSEW